MKRAFLFQLFVIFFVTVFCALGTWQLYRLQWKLELISEITFGLDSKPIEYSNSIKKNYQRVSAKGKFNFNKQIYLYSLNDSGKPGYDVVTPFRTDKNQNVLINRGWIKKELKGSASINFKAESDSEIIGLLREIYKPSIFKVIIWHIYTYLFRKWCLGFIILQKNYKLIKLLSRSFF